MSWSKSSRVWVVAFLLTASPAAADSRAAASFIQSNTSPTACAIASAHERILEFPADRSMGTLKAQRPGDAEWTTLGQARGRYTVDQEWQLKLIVHHDAISDLSPLAGIAPDALVSVVLIGTEVDDGQLCHIGRLTGLRELDLTNTPVSDRGMACLGGLIHLASLRLFRTSVSGDGLVNLGRMTALRHLELGSTTVTDAGLVHLANLPALSTVDLHDTAVTEQGLAHLAKLTSLKRLAIPEMSTDAIVRMRQRLPDCRVTVVAGRIDLSPRQQWWVEPARKVSRFVAVLLVLLGANLVVAWKFPGR